MALTGTNVVVAGDGHIYVAAEGVTAPTDLTAAGTAWTELGYAGDSGISFSYAREEADVNAWQSADPVRIIVTGRTLGIKFDLLEWKPENLDVALGGGTVSKGTAVGTYTYPAVTENPRRAIMFDVTDGSYTFRFFYPSMQQSGDVEVPLVREDAARLPVEFRNLAATVQPKVLANHPAWLS